MKRRISWTVLTCSCMILMACGSKVSGHTYHDNGGVVKVEFESAGKAHISAGPMSRPCSYAESGKKVSLVCDGETTVLTVEDDGALSGPPDGFMARLTRVKD